MSKHRFLSIGLSVLLVVWVIHFATNHLPQSGSIKGHTIAATQGPTALVRALRPNFPYSVIPGGAYSQGELQYAHGADSIIRSHYANFDVKHAKLVNLTDDRFQYVSYRLKDQIYWTKKKLRIPKGELLLTDGVNYARTRCGNRLSDAPHQAATSTQEPDPKLLSLPSMTPEMLPRMALANPPALGAIPPLDPVMASHTGAALPPVEPALPGVPRALTSEPVLTGFAPASTGLPALTTGGGGVPLTASNVPTGGNPVTGNPVTGNPTTGKPTSPPSKPNPPNGPTPPVTIPAPPTDVIPVPEPNTIYLVLLSLVLSVFALLRLGPKDEPR